MNRAPWRLLFVDHVCRILGGAEVNLVELLSEPAARRNWQILTACDPDGRLHEALEPLGVERHPFRIDPALGTFRVVGRRLPLVGLLGGLRALKRARQDLASLVAKLRPHAVISCTNKDHFASWPACRAAGIPSVWWVNDILSADFFPWPARRAFCQQARRGASRLIVVSAFAREALVHEGLPAGRVVTIHNGIPMASYGRRPRGALRGMLSVPESEPLVGIVGRFTPWKGQEFFLRLAEKWCQHSPDGQFALIGHAFNEDQSFELALRDFVRTHGLRTRVHFVPFQRDVASAMSDLDVLVHTSLKPEPFGRVIIEAMAVDVPVLAARDGGVPEIITHGENGLLATPGDLEDYHVQLKALLGDPALRQRLQASAGRMVMERFSVARVREQFDSLMEALV